MSKDYKRTTESKTTTQTIRTVRKNRTTEQRYADRQFTRLILKGL